MSLMPLFIGRKNHSRRVQNSPQKKITTHQSQKNQDYLDFYDPTTTTINQFKANQGEQDLYNIPPPNTNQAPKNLFNPLPTITRITHQSQTSWGQKNSYNPSHEFYLKTPPSLLAPALSFPHEPPFLAQVDYKATPESYVLRANLHGYKKEEVKVQVEDDRVLKISGEKKIIQKEYDNWHHFQRKIGKFSTVFNLPKDARVDKVKSTMENGVLIVTIPKKEEHKNSHVRTSRIL